ncbi:MAG: hypothetical protein ACFFHV_00015 [Promethearchaeota archaeon]
MKSNLKNFKKKEKVWILTGIFIFLIFNMPITSPTKDIFSSTIGKDNNSNEIFEDLKKNEIDVNLNGFNISSNGIGAPWNITHIANRTDVDQKIIGLQNNQYDDSSKVSLFPNWVGYKLEADVKDFYDKRNWCNGTFNFGNDNNYQNPQANDSYTISRISNNQFQNWTFHSYDNTFNFTNPVSGNYLDTTSTTPVNSEGHDCLELRLNGQAVGGTYWYGYDIGDRAWWSTYMNITRGQIIDAELKFDSRAIALMNSNNWELVFYINNKKIWSIGTYTHEQWLQGGWRTKSVLMKDWVDKTVFTGDAADSLIKLDVALEYTSGTTQFGGFTNREYQQILIDNVELIVKAEAKPSQVNLRVNSTNEVYDLPNQWGKGYATIEDGNWNGSENNYVRANFSSIGVGIFGDYELDFTTDLNLYAIKNNPESNYELNVASIGTSFSVCNNSNVNWSTYAFVNVPIGYEETAMIFNFPKDYTISHIGLPTQRNIDIKNSPYCDYLSNPGTLSIEVSKLTSSPNGFWKFMAISPNYCEDINLFNNESGSWVLNSTFISGHSLKVEANISDSPIIKDYIQNVKVFLQIRFPDGNLWTAEEQNKSPDSVGFVSFNPIKIPDIAGSDYQAGVYQAIITLNNTNHFPNLNETGLIFRNFTVIHNSILKPDNDKYFIDGKYDNEKVLLSFSYYDKEDNTAIGKAIVYAKNYTNGIHYFYEPETGSYQLDYDLRDAKAGNNTLAIYAFSNLYLNQLINITIEVTKFTSYSTDLLPNEIPEISFEQNITIFFNYTEINSGKGISTIPSTDFADIQSNPKDYYYFEEIALGMYKFVGNSSAYSAGKRIEFIINLDEPFYEQKIIRVEFDITFLGTEIEVIVNNNQIKEDEKLSYQIWDPINITVKFSSLRGYHLNDANVTLSGIGNLTLHPLFNQFNITLDTTDLVKNSNNIMTIFAERIDYNSQLFEFIIEITDRMTDINVIFNVDGVSTDVTDIPLYEVAIGKQIGVIVKYYDLNLNYINNANVSLGIDYEIDLQKYPTEEQYRTTINTEILGLGHKTISLSALKENYVRQDINLNIIVRKISTEIITKDKENKFTIRPGEKFTLVIEIKDLDFGGKVKGCDVTYEWEFGDGELEEIEDGVYEVELDTEFRPEGSYTIKISAFKEGGRYDFDDYEVTLTIARPEGESLLFLILFLVSICGITALASYYVYYRKVLRFPKPVRKVRKYRRSLKKKSAPSVDIIDRENGFKKVYSEELGKTSKSLKSKIAEEPLIVDKIKKKTTTTSTSEGIKKKTITTSNNKG